eukprot:scaffold194193_cov31-Tisochrysis_lutea.AAC.2
MRCEQRLASTCSGVALAGGRFCCAASTMIWSAGAVGWAEGEEGSVARSLTLSVQSTSKQSIITRAQARRFRASAYNRPTTRFAAAFGGTATILLLALHADATDNRPTILASSGTLVPSRLSGRYGNLHGCSEHSGQGI